MFLSSLITQLAESHQGSGQSSTEDEPDLAGKHVGARVARPKLVHREGGGVSVVSGEQVTPIGRMGMPLGRPGFVTHVIIRRLLAGYPVSGLILMKEYHVPRGTAMSGIDRLAKHGIITVEAGCAGRMRYKQTYQLSAEFAETLRPIGYNFHLF